MPSELPPSRVIARSLSLSPPAAVRLGLDAYLSVFVSPHCPPFFPSDPLSATAATIPTRSLPICSSLSLPLLSILAAAISSPTLSLKITVDPGFSLYLWGGGEQNNKHQSQKKHCIPGENFICNTVAENCEQNTNKTEDSLWTSLYNEPQVIKHFTRSPVCT